MVHEVIHVIEAWAGVEFSEQRVEKLIDGYRQRASEGEQADVGMDFSMALYLAKTEGRRIRRKGKPDQHWSVENGKLMWRWPDPSGGEDAVIEACEIREDDILAEDWEVVDG